MKISVIIPVYNAEKYIEEAVLSAIAEPETAEVILVDDASTDNSSAVCTRLANQHPQVKFFSHSDKRNHGAGASRNLGIENAAFDYIAFLDADDYYVEGRFKKTREVFTQFPDADGVYGCLGIYFENAEAESNWKKRFVHTQTHMQMDVSPAQLAKAMSPIGNKGWFSINTLTVKRLAIEKVGGFGNLPLSQDTEFLLKLAIATNLYPADNNTPVAIRRVHAGNRITSDKEYFYRNRLQLWLNMIEWCKQNKKFKNWIYIFKKHYLKAIFIYIRYKKGIINKCIFVWKSLMQLV